MAEVASPADLAIIRAVKQRGVKVSVRQLRDWRTRRLLPPNDRVWPGGGGSSSTVPAGIEERVCVLAGAIRRGQPASLGAIALFDEGFDVEPDELFAAVRDALASVSETAAFVESEGGTFEAAEYLAAQAADVKPNDLTRPLVEAAKTTKVESVEAVVESSLTSMLDLILGGTGPADLEAEIELAAAFVPESEAFNRAGFLPVVEVMNFGALDEILNTLDVAELRVGADVVATARFLTRLAEQPGFEIDPPVLQRSQRVDALAQGGFRRLAELWVLFAALRQGAPELFEEQWAAAVTAWEACKLAIAEEDAVSE